MNYDFNQKSVNRLEKEECIAKQEEQQGC